MRLAFILGANPTLSTAEILRKLNSENLSFSIISISPHALVLNANFHLENPQKFLNKLGGTIKLAEIQAEHKRLETLTTRHLAVILDKYFPKPPIEGKILFGLSAYDFEPWKSAKDIKAVLNQFANEKKKYYKEQGQPCRFIAIATGTALSSVQVDKNNLLKKGFELVLIRNFHDGRIFTGKTLAVQDFESYNLRDFGRPFPDPRTGMLPPKIAQIMINLSGISPDSCPNKCRLYDPFCGSGTILQEAALLGFDINGSDFNQKSVERSIGNLEWLTRTFKIAINNLGKKIRRIDIANLAKEIPCASVDALVTEPFLGPPLRSLPEPTKIQKIFSKLNSIYQTTLSAGSKILRKNGSLVIVFPKIGKFRLFANFVDKIRNFGYDIVRPLPKNLIETNLDTFTEVSPEGTIFYARPDAKIVREIVVLKKK